MVKSKLPSYFNKDIKFSSDNNTIAPSRDSTNRTKKVEEL